MAMITMQISGKIWFCLLFYSELFVTFLYVEALMFKSYSKECHTIEYHIIRRLSFLFLKALMLQTNIIALYQNLITYHKTVKGIHEIIVIAPFNLFFHEVCFL